MSVLQVQHKPQVARLSIQEKAGRIKPHTVDITNPLHTTHHSVWGSILGSPYFGKVLEYQYSQGVKYLGHAGFLVVNVPHFNRYALPMKMLQW